MNPKLQNTVDHVVEALSSHRAMDVTVMDVSSVTPLCDAFIIATGNSDVHMRALLDTATESLDKDKIEYTVEGERSSQWTLIDTSEIIIHIFGVKSREFYNLDRIWGDVPTKRYENID